MRGLNQEGLDIFRWSVECLSKNRRGSEEDLQTIIGVCLAAQAQCALPYSREHARELADESISILRGVPLRKERILPLKVLTLFAADEAERSQLDQEALDIARAVESG